MREISRRLRRLEQAYTRQAVQEILWLLETVTAAFRQTKIVKVSIQGKYFNKIIRERSQSQRGTAFEQVSEWMMALHGYLSSPTGGAVRHGMDLKAGLATEAHCPGPMPSDCGVADGFPIRGTREGAIN